MSTAMPRLASALRVAARPCWVRASATSMRESRVQMGIQSTRKVAKAGDATVHPSLGKTPENKAVTAAIRAAGDRLSFDEACAAFNSCAGKDVILYNAILAVANKCGKYREGLDQYRAMLAAGLQPDVVTCTEVIRCCGRLGMYDYAHQLFEYVRAAGLAEPSERVVFLAIISAAAHAGNLGAAQERFGELKSRGICAPEPSHYGALMHACRRARHAEAALRVLREMRADGPRPDVVHYTAAMGALRGRPLDEVRALDALFREDRVQTNEHYLEEHVASCVGFDLNGRHTLPADLRERAGSDRIDAALAVLAEGEASGVKLKRLLRRLQSHL